MTKQQLTEEEFEEWLVESRTSRDKYAKESTLFNIKYKIASMINPVLAEALLVNRPVKAEDFYEPREYYSSRAETSLFTLGKNPKGEDLTFDSFSDGNLLVFGKGINRNPLLESLALQSLDISDTDLTHLYVAGKHKMASMEKHRENPKVTFLSSSTDTVEELKELKEVMMARYDEMVEASCNSYLKVPNVGDYRVIFIIQNIGDMIRQDINGLLAELVNDIVRLSRAAGIVLLIGAETLEDLNLIPGEIFANLGNKLITGEISKEEKDRLIVKWNDRPITAKYYSGEKGTGLFCSYVSLVPLTLSTP